MYTVGELARRHGLSRSTLLYYDRIGILRPARRGQGEYHHYSEDDARRLGQICLYRQTGLSLAAIARLLAEPGDGPAALLEERLEKLNREIASLRQQQHLILGLLQNPALAARVGVMNRRMWVDLLAASGFSPEDMRRWHWSFERRAPEKHQRFLEFLGLPAAEIAQIRRRSQEPDPPA